MADSMKNGIQVSVIMPAYNCERYIEDAINSALGQEVSLELLIINDASTDNTEQVISKYLDNPCVRYYKNEKNLGAAASRNKGVKYAGGRYVAFLDADDIWMPGKLKKQLKRMCDEQAVICSTGRELIDSAGNSLGKYIPVHERISYKMLLRQNEINCSSVVLLRDVALELPMEHEECHEDYLTWMKILKKYKFATAVNEPLLKYRLSNEGKSGGMLKLRSALMTYKTYRAAGFGHVKSLTYFVSYALHGIWKYRGVSI